MLGEGASRRGRAGIVRNPVRDTSGARVLPDVVRGDHSYAATLGNRNSGTIDSRPEAACIYPIRPRVDISSLLGQHPSAFLLIQKNDGSLGKPFATRVRNRSSRVGTSEVPTVCGLLQFCVQSSIEKDQEPEADS